MNNLIEATRYWAKQNPEKVAYTFLNQQLEETATMTYAELDQRARDVAVELSNHYQVGDSILLIFEQGINFICAFLGSIYAGMVPVPSVPPRKNAKSIERLRLTIADAGCVCVISETSILAKYSLSDLCDLTIGDVCKVPTSAKDQWQMPTLTENSTAFLQYTSGSTSAPKGVMVSHRNIYDNENLIQTTFGSSTEDVIVGWLPLFHDMGLIGNLLHPLHIGGSGVLMSPTTFITNPESWIIAISRYRGTISGGPDFSYRLVIDHISDETLKSVDLSCWRVAYNGAEPILADTLTRFSQKMTGTGFDKRNFLPCYGLAESTLLVTAKFSHTPPIFGHFNKQQLQNGQAIIDTQSDESIELVSSGVAPDTVELVIVDPQSHKRLPDGEIGEVWVNGHSVANGYWQKIEKSIETFEARIDGEGDKQYLRTGDLGFLQQKALFVTGRIKDLIIIRGQNYFPAEIERLVQQVAPGLMIGGSAAFAANINGVEQLVVAQEVARGHIRKIDIEAVTIAAKQVIAEEMGITLYDLVLVKPASLPKTTSGKIRRVEIARRYSAAEIERLADASNKAPTTAQSVAQTPDQQVSKALTTTEQRLVSLLVERFHLAGINTATTISKLGLDSLALVQFSSAIARDHGIKLGHYQFDEMNIAAVAALIDKSGNTAQTQVKSMEVDKTIVSVSEEHFLHLDQYLEEPSSLNVHMAFACQQPIAVEHLQAALEHICIENPILLSHYASASNVSRVNSEQALTIESIDASDINARQHMLEDFANQNFALDQGPLVRVGLFRTQNQQDVLCIVGHHAVLDLLSLVSLTKQLLENYQLYKDPSKTAKQPQVDPQYALFCQHQQQTSVDESENGALHFWRNKLSDISCQYNNRYFNSRANGKASALYMRSDKAFVTQISQLADQLNCSEYVAMMALFNLVMHRHVGSDKLMVTSPFSGRSEHQWSETIGTMINPAWVTSKTHDHQSVADFFAAMKQEVNGCLQHQNGHVYRVLTQAQDANFNIDQLSQISFAYQANYQTQGFSEFICGDGAQTITLGSEVITNVPVARRATQGKLEFFVAREQDYYQLRVDWLKQGLNQAQVEAIIADLFAAARLVNEQGAQIEVTSLHQQLSFEQRNALPSVSNQAITPAQDLLTMLKTGLALDANKVAIKASGKNLTYAEVNQLANQMATHLVNHCDIKPGDSVAVMLPRDQYLIPTLLGIWLAGACYVSLDPNHPQSRSLAIIETAQPKLVLTDNKANGERDFADTQLIDVQSIWQTRDSGAQTLVTVANDLPAYILFTSGSTGKPKGVVISRANVANYLEQMKTNPGIVADDVVLAMTTIAFDISITELFLPLVQGSTIIMANDSQMTDADQMCQLIAEYQPNLVQTTPSRIKFLFDYGLKLRSDAKVILAGEPLSPAVADLVLAQTDVLWNMYGPTEATVMSSRKQVLPNQKITLGHALPNTHLYVLDAKGCEVPVGVAAELYIGGACVADGYINQPELTAQRFIDNPFIADPAAKMYRTGDLVSRDQDGELHYHGRIDNQVKLRGNRIELEEVEYALKSTGLIKEAIVRVEQNQNEELVAYCELKGEQKQADIANQLFEKLMALLPLYMIPSHFYQVSEFNIGPTGKVDRNNLPTELELISSAPEESRELTATEVQVKLIWCEILNNEMIGIHDNFFVIGGNSLTAMAITRRVENDFNLHIPPKAMYELPTVAALAEFIELTTGHKPLGDAGADSEVIEL